MNHMAFGQFLVHDMVQVRSRRRHPPTQSQSTNAPTQSATHYPPNHSYPPYKQDPIPPQLFTHTQDTHLNTHPPIKSATHHPLSHTFPPYKQDPITTPRLANSPITHSQNLMCRFPCTWESGSKLRWTAART